MSGQHLLVGRPSGPFHVLVQWATTTGAFRRNRVNPETKVLAAALCNAGYSYRQVARMVGGLSHVAAKDAYFSLTTSLPDVEKRPRRSVSIDGSDVPRSGRTFRFWLARDVDSGEIMEFSASPTASAEDGAKFLSLVASHSTNRPLLRLGLDEDSLQGLVNLDLYFEASPNYSLIGRLGRLLLGARASSGNYGYTSDGKSGN